MSVPSTTSTLNNLIQTYFYKVGMERLSAKALLYTYAEKTPLPAGSGTTVRWNGWSNFAVVSVALTEATNASCAASLSARKIEATVAQYGRVVRISDLAEYSSVLDVVKGAVDTLTDCAAKSVDAVIQLAIFKSTLAANSGNTILSVWMSCVASGFHAGSNGSSSTLAWGFPVVFGSSANQLSMIDKSAPSASATMGGWIIKKAVKQLRRKNAMEMADGNFVLLTNSDAGTDLQRDGEVKGWYQNISNSVVVDGVIQGKPSIAIFGARVITSNMMPRYRATAHSCDVSFMFGKGAFGVTQFGTNGKSGFELIIKRSGDGDTSNPMNMYSTVAFKFTMAAAALNVSAGRVLITHSKP